MKITKMMCLLLAVAALQSCKNDCESRCEKAFDDAKARCAANVAASAKAMAGMPGVADAAKGISGQCETQAEAMKSSCATACK